MQVKQFRQPTVRQALQAIREDLGPTALVRSSQMVAARGWRGWLGMREVQLTVSMAGAAPDSRPVAALSRSTDTSSPTDGIVARLLASGLTRSMAEGIAEGLSPSERRGASLRELQRALATQMEAITAGEEAFARVEVFIGPPGVGKTTTIAKIAAQERALRGRALGLVSADAFRAGAVEQLRAYAHIIGAPFRIARTIEELDEALTRGRTPVLVDTAGRSPSDGGLRNLRRLLGSRRGVRTHLVMAADTSATSARRILDAYRDIHPHRLVITKIDEAESLAPLLGVLAERQIPVSYMTAGQRVPDDLARATSAGLAAAVLRDEPAAWAAVAC